MTALATCKDGAVTTQMRASEVDCQRGVNKGTSDCEEWNAVLVQNKCG